jgi:hypothetical protein
MKYDFVEIGTCDFDTLVQKASTESTGICIDVIKTYLDRLPDLPGVVKLNVAVSDLPGKDLFYYLEEEDIHKHGLPEWTRGCGSLGTPHPFILEELQKRNLSGILQVKEVEKIPIDQILQKYLVTELGVLKLDLEGHDLVVLNSFLDCKKVLPNKIIFEHIPEFGSQALFESCLQKLQGFGYVQTQNFRNNYTFERKFREDGKHRIMVVTSFDQNYLEMSKMTAGQNFEIYCQLNNYALYKDFIPDDFDRAPQWRKIKILSELISMDLADWFFFVDCDCLFMNFSEPLENFVDESIDIILTKTGGAPDYELKGNPSENTYMSAQMLVKNSKVSLQMLEEIWDAPDWPSDLSINAFDHEMRQMRFTLNKDLWKKHYKIIPEKKFNRFWPCENPFFVMSFPHHNQNSFEAGDFIVHVVGRPKQERLSLLAKLQIFSGGLLAHWNKEENKVFMEPLVNLNRVRIFCLNSKGEATGEWYFDFMKKGTQYWIGINDLNPEDLHYKCFLDDNFNECVAFYKFYVNPEYR